MILKAVVLWSRHSVPWTKPLPRWAREGCRFERGFPGHVTGYPKQVLRDARGLWDKVPVRHLCVRNVDVMAAAALAGTPGLGRLRSLRLERGPVSISFGASELGRSAWLARLEALDLGAYPIGPDDFRTLLRRDAFRHLHGFALCDSGLGWAGMEILRQSSQLDALTALDLERNGLDDRALGPLVGAGHLSGLTHLCLTGNVLGPGAVRLLAKAPFWSSLAVLLSNHNRLGEAGLRALAEATPAPRLRALDLGENQVGDRGAEVLASWSGLSSLTALSLAGNGIGPDGATALAQSSHLGPLALLDLGHNRIGDRGLEVLASSPALQGLTELRVPMNEITNAAWIAFASSPLLPRLRSLEAGSGRFQRATVERLKARVLEVS